METLGYSEEERLAFLGRYEPTATAPDQLAALRSTIWPNGQIDNAIQMGW